MAGSAAAVGVVLLLLVTGVVQIFPTVAGNPGISYSTARTLADGVLPTGYGPAPTVLAATGIESRETAVLPVQSFTNNTTSNCTQTELTGYPTSGNLTIPSYGGSWNSGLAPFWLFAFEASASGPYAIVAVVSSSPLPLATLSGPGCSTGSPGTHPLPSGVVDSPVAARSAWNHSASTFVSGDANATTETMAAFGGSSSGLVTAPVWAFVYGPCTPLVTGPISRPGLVVLVGLTTAAFQVSSTFSAKCPT